MTVDIFFLQEEFYGREIILADRDMVETNSGNFSISIFVRKGYDLKGKEKEIIPLYDIFITYFR